MSKVLLEGKSTLKIDPTILMDSSIMALDASIWYIQTIQAVLMISYSFNVIYKLEWLQMGARWWYNVDFHGGDVHKKRKKTGHKKKFRARVHGPAARLILRIFCKSDPVYRLNGLVPFCILTFCSFSVRILCRQALPFPYQFSLLWTNRTIPDVNR